MITARGLSDWVVGNTWATIGQTWVGNTSAHPLVPWVWVVNARDAVPYSRQTHSGLRNNT